jgi:hypothetical protein
MQKGITQALKFALEPVPEESMLRTPSVTDSTGGAISEDQARERGRMVKTADQVAQLAFENGLKVSPTIAASLLPTPVVNDMGAGKTVERWDEWTAETKEKHQNGNGHGPSLNIEMMRLLGTPRTSSANAATDRQIDAGAPKNRLEDQVVGGARGVIEWGKFEPAIRRWETVLGRPAPAPTLPDGKDGAHRLSKHFTEWMMGLPEGWICDADITRNEALKLAGNGVVPQQAELALRILLGESNMSQRERERERLFPTPTVSDTFTDNLKSTQQSEGSMHSVTLPQAVRMVIKEETNV